MREHYMVRALFMAQARTLISHLTRSICYGPPASSASDAALKNVTRSNFEAALAELRRWVKEADFVSIDLEMTGVTSAPWRESFEFDRPDIQYLKIKDSAEKFAVVQFGVCPFRWDPHTHSFVTHPHNFYIFPRQEIPGEGTSEFLCQTSSLEFLAKHQFNFNACIYEGISYLSRSQEEEALRRLDSLHKDEFPDLSSNSKEVTDIRLVRIADILFSERMKNKISEWRAGLLQNKSVGSDFLGNSNDTIQKFQTTFFKMRPALIVNDLTPCQSRLIKLVTEKHFKDLAYIHVNDEASDPQTLIVYTDSTTDRDILMKEVKAHHRKETELKIKAMVGFRHVVDLLSSESKLIVGHNCFLDIAHVYSKFIGPLPSSAEEFVSAVQGYFPYIVDTKVLLNANDALFHVMKKGSTSLSKAFTLLCPQIAAAGVTTSDLADKSRIKVEVQVDDQRFSNWNSGAKHEAGYDAFMTGCVFAQACCHLGIDFSNRAPPVDLLHNVKLQKYVNHLFLSWVNGDIINLKTGKSNAESLGSTNLKKLQKIMYSNMVLLWGLKSNLRARDIRGCICKVFGSDSVTTIYYLDDTAAFVQFSKAELASDFLELKDTLERENDPISVLHPLSKILGGCTRAASYEIYKEICSSPLSEVLFADQADAIGIKWKTRLVEPVSEVEKQDDETSGKENKVNVCSVCLDLKEMDPKTSAIDSLSICHLPTDELRDSQYPIEAQSSK